ncbi:hypothetical protein, partial [Streptomyces alboviridis]|uniref:hypothetical protein n=1 Tax=Streptomyces alboviridis TaxID=67269 RepID=UPI000516112B
MDGYGKPGYTREEFEQEMNAELDEVSALDREYQPGGIMASGPVYADRRDIGPVMTMDETDAFIRHMSAQDPVRLEQD